MNLDLWIIVNMAVGWIATIYVFIHAMTRANGKKRIRILMSAVLLYSSIVYTMVFLGVINFPEFGSIYFRPFMVIYFFFPVWEAMSDVQHQNPKGDK